MTGLATAIASEPRLGSSAPPREGRLMSLDVFRGATIAGMMLVNNPGNWSAIYPPLEHAEWHGWTYTDTIFPFFLWIVGVAIPLSTAKRLGQGQTRSELFVHALRRALILFAIGIFLNGFPWYDFANHRWIDFGHLRIPGVLQRIAICYFFASVIFLQTRLRGQIVWTASLLAVYWLLMAFVPVPQIINGQMKYVSGIYELDGNFAHYIDQLVLSGDGWNHMWKASSVSRTWDPEGIVSTIPAIATCLFGILAGQLLRTNKTAEEKTAWLFVAGALLMFAGEILKYWLPINKKIWTSTYSIFMAGLAMNVFAVCYWLVDVKGRRKWAKPFAIYGMNAIMMFVLAGLIARILGYIKFADAAGKKISLHTFLFQHTFAQIPDPKIASHTWALAYVFGLFLIAWLMYRRKWFVRF